MHSVFANTVIASSGRIFNAALGIIVVGLITRQLGPAGYGSFVLLLSFGTIIQLLSDAGLYLTLTKEVAQTKTPSRLFSELLSLRIVLIVTAFLTGSLFFPLFSSLRGWIDVYWIIALGLACQSLSQLLVGVFQYRGEIWRATLGDLVGRAAQVVLLVIVWPLHPSVTLVALIFTVSTAFSLLLHQLFLPRPFLVRPKVNLLTWRRLIRVSWPLGLMLLLNAIYFRVDTLVLSLFWDSAEVGRYGVAYRIIESGLFFSAMFGGLLLPRISAALSSRDTALAGQYLNDGLKFLTVIVMPVGTILFFLSPAIVSLVAGPEFIGSAPILSWLSFALVVMYFGNLFGFVMVALNRQKSLLALSACLVVFNLLANFVLIPRGGALAAAWTTIFTELISAGTAAVLVYRSLFFYLPIRFMLKVGLVLAGGIATIFITRLYPAYVQLAISLFSFIVLTVLTRIISKKELTILRSA